MASAANNTLNRETIMEAIALAKQLEVFSYYYECGEIPLIKDQAEKWRLIEITKRIIDFIKRINIDKEWSYIRSLQVTGYENKLHIIQQLDSMVGQFYSIYRDCRGTFQQTCEEIENAYNEKSVLNLAVMFSMTNDMTTLLMLIDAIFPLLAIARSWPNSENLLEKVSMKRKLPEDSDSQQPNIADYGEEDDDDKMLERRRRQKGAKDVQRKSGYSKTKEEC